MISYAKTDKCNLNYLQKYKTRLNGKILHSFALHTYNDTFSDMTEYTWVDGICKSDFFTEIMTILMNCKRISFFFKS